MTPMATCMPDGFPREREGLSEATFDRGAIGRETAEGAFAVIGAAAAIHPGVAAAPHYSSRPMLEFGRFRVNVGGEPGGFKAISRWLRPQVDTTGPGNKASAPQRGATR